MGHVPLHAHLARIRRAPSPTCPTGGETPETVAHYILLYPTYSLTRATIFAPLGRSCRALRDLLNTKRGLKLLFRFVNATKRFQRAFGTFQELPDDFDTDPPDPADGATRRTRPRGRN